ncbi:hypothetical protein LEP1GSC058_3487 [Leptospira fainei serovar Hurstbridge str. BUT 6]|uniref:Uncharacterized protein n=1 Tax=Leptospira fainei serovar Hurstbridge str. BUT 6 TaxID=1193011 RepID=S3VD75_9LEPT|nr:hypothetical protein LEP1GSC058_3487 [Leptospira fainei serovar Hurstbridge str. BUT 6]
MDLYEKGKGSVLNKKGRGKSGLSSKFIREKLFSEPLHHAA